MGARLKGWLVLLLLGGTMAYCIAEELTLTTYYPSPRGVYNELRTRGDVAIGKLDTPSARLEIVGGGATAATSALRIKNVDQTSLLEVQNGGNVGIGITSPNFKLDVNGIVNGTDIYKNGVPLTVIPAGAVMSFNLSTCPPGWSPYAPARGRYIVGVPSGGTVGGTQGTPLTNLEDRPVGRHTHTTTPPLINDYREVGWCGAAGGGYPNYIDLQPGCGGDGRRWWGGTLSGGITINDAGSVAGIPAPYVQLLVCQKD